MSTRLASLLKSIEDGFGKALGWLWKLLICPVAILCIYSGTAYLDRNYVTKEYFDNSISSLLHERERASAKQEAALREISQKLDALIVSSAANGQRFADSERRLSRLEDKVDQLRQ